MCLQVCVGMFQRFAKTKCCYNYCEAVYMVITRIFSLSFFSFILFFMIGEQQLHQLTHEKVCICKYSEACWKPFRATVTLDILLMFFVCCFVWVTVLHLCVYIFHPCACLADGGQS